MQQIRKRNWAISFVISAAMAGSALIGYHVGRSTGAMRCKILWDLNDLAQARRFEVNSTKEEDIIKLLRAAAIERHNVMLMTIHDSVIRSIIVGQSKDTLKAIDRVNSFIEEAANKK